MILFIIQILICVIAIIGNLYGILYLLNKKKYKDNLWDEDLGQLLKNQATIFYAICIITILLYILLKIMGSIGIDGR